MKRWKKEMEDILNEMRKIKGWKKEFSKMKEKVKEGIKSQGIMLREEMDKIRNEFKRRKFGRGKERK